MIVILDYGMGNLRSVERAVRHLGYTCEVQPDLRGATKLIIPGVGAFGAAMERLASLKADICRFAESSPILGICLGQQLLFETSEEKGSHSGLGLLRGHVAYLPKIPGIKIPHMGWNTVSFRPGSTLGRGFPQTGQVYFVHSLITVCEKPSDIAGVSTHGVEFAATVERDHIFGTQFHPEKSGDVGLALLDNFLAL